jgi:hypothetical protein
MKWIGLLTALLGCWSTTVKNGRYVTDVFIEGSELVVVDCDVDLVTTTTVDPDHLRLTLETRKRSQLKTHGCARRTHALPEFVAEHQSMLSKRSDDTYARSIDVAGDRLVVTRCEMSYSGDPRTRACTTEDLSLSGVPNAREVEEEQRREACIAERKRIAQRAQQITDVKERARVYQSMPECGPSRSVP